MTFRLIAPLAALLTALAVLPATGRIEPQAPQAPVANQSAADVVTIRVPEEDLARCRATLAQVTGAPVDAPPVKGATAIAPVSDGMPVARCVVE